MLRRVILLALLGAPVAAWAQVQQRPAPNPGTPTSQPPQAHYRPAVPPPSVAVGGYYGGGGYGGGGTVAGNAMQGMASVISSQGSYNLATSAAAVNLTQAEKQDIANRVDATNAYFEMRAINRAATEAERGPRLTAEQLRRISQEQAPRPLNSMQVDPISGRVAWPALLQDQRYTAERAEVDQIVAKQVTFGGLGLSDQTRAREAIENMFATMKDQVREVPPQQYTTARTFLRSLMYATTKTDL